MLKIAQAQVPGYPHAACFDHVAAALKSAAQHFPDAEGKVVIGANLMRELPPGCIVWNFEQVEPGSDWMNEQYLAICRNAEQLWDYSPQNVYRWRIHYGIEARLLPLAYDPAMVGVVPKCQQKLARPRFYGSMNERRQAILGKIQHHPLNPPIYGAKLDRELGKSPCVINIHYYEAAIFEIVRCSYLFANGVPVMSEQCADQHFYNMIPDLFHKLDDMERQVRRRRYPDGDAQRRAYMGAPHLKDYLEHLLK